MENEGLKNLLDENKINESTISDSLNQTSESR